MQLLYVDSPFEQEPARYLFVCCTPPSPVQTFLPIDIKNKENRVSQKMYFRNGWTWHNTDDGCLACTQYADKAVSMAGSQSVTGGIQEGTHFQCYV